MKINMLAPTSPSPQHSHSGLDAAAFACAGCVEGVEECPVLGSILYGYRLAMTQCQIWDDVSMTYAPGDCEVRHVPILTMCLSKRL